MIEPAVIANKTRALLDLAKIRISALAGLSATTGYILAADGVSAGAVAPAAGVLLAAAGSCAMNQLQERHIDGRMLRTRDRPIPRGETSPRAALWFSLVALAAGASILAICASPAASALALLAAGWYNGVYTNLKRVTRFAAIPGGLVGAVSPAIGWIAAGGSMADPEILSLMVFMFVWQVPHFWLLLLSRREDFEAAGLPSVTDALSPAQLGRISFVWISAAAVGCTMIPLLGGALSPVVPSMMGAAAIWLIAFSGRHLAWPGPRKHGAAAPADMAGPVYVRLNLYALFVLSLLSAGGILGGRL